MRCARLLPAVDDDLSIGTGPHAGGGKVEPGGIGHAAEGIEKMVGATSDCFAVVDEFHGHAALIPGDALDLGAGEKLDALVDEGLLHDVGGVVRMVAQDVRAALDERDARADAVEELGELAGHDAAAKHGHAARHKIEIQHVVARPERGVMQAGHGRNGGLRSRADEKVLCAQFFSIGQLDRVRIDEAGMAAM